MATAHGGFIIPNAEGSASTKMAEPDQVDFNTLGNGRWGVVSGCSVSITGTIAAIGTPGIAVVDGSIVNVSSGQSVTLGAGGSQPRFDLVGVNAAGSIVSVSGTPAADPVYPDVPVDVTILAAVFCPVGSSTFNLFLSDKRKFFQPVFVSTGTGTDTVLVNRSGGSDTFRVDASGRMEWANSDAFLYRSAAATLRSTNLVLDGSLTAAGSLTVTGAAVVTGDLRSANFIKLANGSAFPTAAQGTILQIDGRVYVQTAASAPMNWEQVVTASGTNQPGDIKQSMRSPSQMVGWIPFNGATITETQHPQLFTVDGLAPFIVPGSPRAMVLPDATERILLPTQSNPGVTGGSNTITISLNNLPAHVHGVSVAPNGAHGHAATMAPNGGHEHNTLMSGANSGRHGHGVDDPGHAHNGADGWGGVSGWAFIALAWGGRNKLDGPINDSSHTYSVEPSQWTAKAQSGVSITAAGSEHQHQTDTKGDHAHGITIEGAAQHGHTVSENAVGSNAPLTITPRYLTVYTYIKT
jgi:hypothetical protein